MDIRKATGLSAAVVLLSAALAHAGPCSKQIFDIQVEFDARLNAAAAAGPTGPETSAATMHRQPTPRSVAHAEENLGDISKENAQAFAAALKLAREADAAGDEPACAHALDDARRALGH